MESGVAAQSFLGMVTYLAAPSQHSSKTIRIKKHITRPNTPQRCSVQWCRLSAGHVGICTRRYTSSTRPCQTRHTNAQPTPTVSSSQRQGALWVTGGDEAHSGASRDTSAGAEGDRATLQHGARRLVQTKATHWGFRKKQGALEKPRCGPCLSLCPTHCQSDDDDNC
jgi:hypothetical protein